MFKDPSGNYRMKIAFDYDDTLTDPVYFNLAKRLIEVGHDVWILTSRTNDEQYKAQCEEHNIPVSTQERNQDLKSDAEKLGLSEKIIYTYTEDKLEFYQEHQFDLLFETDVEWHGNSICENGGIAVQA